MSRLSILRHVAAPLALVVGAMPAVAAPALVRIVPTATVALSDQVVGDSLFRCGADGCVTTDFTSTPATICAQAARKFGRIDSMTVGTATLDAAALAKCNTRAKSAAKASPNAVARSN